jgi:predicted amidophosphoribosyltransferase
MDIYYEIISNMHPFLYSLLSIFVDIEEEKMIFSPQDLTEHYRREIPYCVLDGIFVATHYHDIDRIIEGYKYRSEREKARVLSDILQKLYLSRRKHIPDGSIAICSVPMHWSRYLIRGFDHVAILGEQLAKKENIPFQKLL